MHPVLFQFGAVTVYTYGVLVAAGVLLGLWYARSQAPRAGLAPESVWSIGIYMILAALLGAKLWLILSAWDFYLANPGQIFSLATFQSAGTFYGGVVGAIVMIVGYTWYKKIPVLALCDTFAAALPLGHAIGRLGCFTAGCCYGKPTTVPWAVTFTSDLAARISGTPLHVRLHPTQLYEASAEFLNFLFLIWLGRRQQFSGQILGAYLILYGLERGTIEFFRGDPGRTLMFNNAVSLMQLVSLALIAAGCLLWWRGLRGASPLPATVREG